MTVRVMMMTRLQHQRLLYATLDRNLPRKARICVLVSRGPSTMKHSARSIEKMRTRRSEDERGLQGQHLREVCFFKIQRGWQCVIRYWTIFSFQIGVFLASWMDGVRFDTKLPQARSRLGLHKASIKPDTYYEM